MQAKWKEWLRSVETLLIGVSWTWGVEYVESHRLEFLGI